MGRLPRGQVRPLATSSGGLRLTIPSPIARMVDARAVFAVELTDEGILYRYVEGAAPVALPAWLTKGEK